jgi:type III secretion protein U
MMSKEEIKREYKESEGDPHVKGHRKQVAMELVMGDGPAQAKKASALVVNPTHLAIALLYKPGETPLPVVTAKGAGAFAVDMRAEAERAGVPIFHNVALARHLYADAEVHGFIPEDVFDVVAEILAWVARNEALLYKGPLQHGDLDMLRGDHRPSAT